MKKSQLDAVLLLAGLIGVLVVVYNTFPNSTSVKKETAEYQVEVYEPGDYIVNGRNYFEDGEDFMTHVCFFHEFENNCGTLTQTGESAILTIKQPVMDDSINSIEEIYLLKTGGSINKLYVAKIQSRWACQSGRGPTSLGIVPCF